MGYEGSNGLPVKRPLNSPVSLVLAVIAEPQIGLNGLILSESEHASREIRTCNAGGHICL